MIYKNFISIFFIKILIFLNKQNYFPGNNLNVMNIDINSVIHNYFNIDTFTSYKIIDNK